MNAKEAMEMKEDLNPCQEGCRDHRFTEAEGFLAATKAAEPLLEVIEKLLKALKAQRQMRDFSHPTKLSEELCWRENDELANKWADDALSSSAQVVEIYKKETLGE